MYALQNVIHNADTKNIRRFGPSTIHQNYSYIETVSLVYVAYTSYLTYLNVRRLHLGYPSVFLEPASCVGQPSRADNAPGCRLAPSQLRSLARMRSSESYLECLGV
jgi:hypothetical protein